MPLRERYDHASVLRVANKVRLWRTFSYDCCD